MKKLLVFTLVFALLAVPVVHAEDYASMTDDELWAANKAIQAELWARSITKNGVTIPKGEYLVGEDIPVGVYRVETPDGGLAAILSVYATDEKSLMDGKMYSVTKDSGIGKLDLTGYKYIEFSNSVTFYAYTGLFN